MLTVIQRSQIGPYVPRYGRLATRTCMPNRMPMCADAGLTRLDVTLRNRAQYLHRVPQRGLG
ncbi:MAG: hypothetical protein QOG22_4339 [Pseudonocardiales bacterium]|jgi:hypothetical protein|nr:hypothetical protein [Pseudonocardiales bacterium]MDT4979843.1 hypothetical protein [Pseudonocardiales bacterium]